MLMKLTAKLQLRAVEEALVAYIQGFFQYLFGGIEGNKHHF
jgi:hypothetical protein